MGFLVTTQIESKSYVRSLMNESCSNPNDSVVTGADTLKVSVSLASLIRIVRFH